MRLRKLFAIVVTASASPPARWPRPTRRAFGARASTKTTSKATKKKKSKSSKKTARKSRKKKKKGASSASKAQTPEPYTGTDDGEPPQFAHQAPAPGVRGKPLNVAATPRTPTGLRSLLYVRKKGMGAGTTSSSR